MDGLFKAFHVFPDHGLISHLYLAGILFSVVVSKITIDYSPYTNCRTKGVVSFIGRILYNLYLHPLKSYPGPWFARASRIPFVYYQTTGRLPQEMMKWHEKYGDTIRIAPNDLSYIQGQAWFDIHGMIRCSSPGTRSLTCHKDIEPHHGLDGLRRTRTIIRPYRAEQYRLYGPTGATEQYKLTIGR